MPFVKGESGNPAGRSKTDVELRRIARTHARLCIAVQLRLLRSADERVRLAASDSILNRGFGKPAQAIEVSGELETKHFVLTGVPEIKEPEQWERLNRIQ